MGILYLTPLYKNATLGERWRGLLFSLLDVHDDPLIQLVWNLRHEANGDRFDFECLEWWE